MKEKAKEIYDEKIAQQMFHDVEEMHKFHAQMLSPNLRERLVKW